MDWDVTFGSVQPLTVFDGHLWPVRWRFGLVCTGVKERIILPVLVLQHLKTLHQLVLPLNMFPLYVERSHVIRRQQIYDLNDEIHGHVP